MYNFIVVSMMESNVLARGGKNMGWAIYGGFVRGLGTIRVDGSCYGSDDLTKVGREIMFRFNIIRGPIRIYARGPNDLRLEYDFEVQTRYAEKEADWLHGQVQNIVLEMLKIKGRWNHNHWLGIELVS